MKLKFLNFLIVTILLVTSCKKDDNILQSIPPKLLSEVTPEDDAAILTFLKTHSYNKAEFLSPPADFDFKIRFDTITADTPNAVSIFDSGDLVTEVIPVTAASLGRSDDETLDQTLYVLIARQGAVQGTPTIGDNVILNYEGMFLDGTLFDAASSQPIVFNLSSVVRGFGNGMEYFQTGNGPIENGDGTISYEDFGVGAIFIPSPLGYFDRPSGLIPSYTPLIFTVGSLAYQMNTDLDGDGIPSIEEDRNNDGNLNNDNTDGDFSQSGAIYDYLDPDDDGDGIPTLEEISDENGNIIKPYPDTDKDGTPDYLDNDL